MPDTGGNLGRALLGIDPALPTVIVPTVTATLLVVSEALVTNDSGSAINITLWRFLTGDTINPPDRLAKIVGGGRLASGQTMAFIRGLYLPLGSSLYGVATVLTAAIATVDGGIRTP